MSRRLEIGPGRKRHARIDGFETCGLEHCQHVVEWGAEPLPFEDGTFVELYSSHCLEHVPWFRSVEALREAARVLAPGGLIEIWVPDFGYIVRCYQESRCGDPWRSHNPEGDPMTWANGRIFTYGPAEPNWHRAAFDEDHLRRCMTKAGFTDVEKIAARTRGVSHGPIDLGMKARKP